MNCRLGWLLSLSALAVGCSAPVNNKCDLNLNFDKKCSYADDKGDFTIYSYTYTGFSFLDVTKVFYASTVTVQPFVNSESHQVDEVGLLVDSVDNDLQKSIEKLFSRFSQPVPPSQSTCPSLLLKPSTRTGSLPLRKQFSPFGQSKVYVAVRKPREPDIKCTSAYESSLLKMMLVGLLMIACARKCAESISFQYFSGVSLVFLTSALIGAYVLFRVLQKAPQNAAKAFAFSAVSFFIPHHFFGLKLDWLTNAISEFWVLAKDMLTASSLEDAWTPLKKYGYTHWLGVLVYLILLGLFGFALAHWKLQGGLTPQSADILTWTIRMIGLCLIYGSSKSVVGLLEIAAALVIILILGTFYFPEILSGRISHPDRFSTHRLSTEEYEEQGREYTRMEQQKLFNSREYREYMHQQADRITYGSQFGGAGIGLVRRRERYTEEECQKMCYDNEPVD